MHRAKDNEIRDILERAVIKARGPCDTEDELDDSPEEEEEKEVEEEKEETSEASASGGLLSVNGTAESSPQKSELLSPVRSIPDAMEKDNGNEKGLDTEINASSGPAPGEINTHNGSSASNGDTDSSQTPDAVKQLLANYGSEETGDSCIDENDFKENLTLTD